MTELLRIEDLVVRFGGRKGSNAVDELNLNVNTGEVLAIVGESGSGKSTLARAVLRVQRIASGRILFDGEDITHLSERQLRPFRRRMQMVFQDPYTSLDPLVSVGSSILEPRRAFSLGTANSELAELMTTVGLSTEFRGRKPSELSGGQRQRAAIARTLVLEPDVLLMDEPFAALDAPTREDLQNLTVELQREQNLTLVFVTHNIEDAVFLGRKILVLGQPPHTTPVVIENPSAGSLAYRSESAFFEMCARVRESLTHHAPRTTTYA